MNITGIASAINQGASLKQRIEARQAERAAEQFVPVNARGRRRAADRAFARMQKKGKKRYTQRALLEQRVTADLAHQFNLIDGLGFFASQPASPEMKERVQTSLEDKVDLLIREDQKRFEKEWSAAADAFWAEHPDAELEEVVNKGFEVRPTLTEDQAWTQLRGLASGKLVA